jgi:[methyl-Co(III) methanol-specific corrinoid protein]:coenzyme M methyltransferase
MADMTSRERFLLALRRKPTDRPAVGNPTSIATTDLMEQTGFFFPEVHNDAEKMAGLAAAGHELLGYDTVAPYFSVVQEAAALGAKVDWGDAQHMPTVRPFPDGRYRYREPDEITVPDGFLDQRPTRTVLDAIRLLKERYGDQVAIVGKIFGPWTLAYHLYGIENLLLLVIDDPVKLRRLLEKLTEIAVTFGPAQVEAGADCLTLGDHLTGDICRPETYRDFLLPAHRELRRRLLCPILLHICGHTLDRLDYICQTGFAAFHFDSRNDARKVVKVAAGRLALIGNVNNPDTLLRGKEARIVQEVNDALAAGVDIIGPECAVPLNTKYRHLRLIAEAAWQARTD